tara:strand:+ start:4635 stop:4871 length:237 start_codon:yes stop_codon:yes gene_type:complete
MSLKIWDVLEGPTSREDCPHSNEWPDGANYSILCKIEEEGEIFKSEFYFEVSLDAYEWKTYFETNIEPILINTGVNDA